MCSSDLVIMMLLTPKNLINLKRSRLFDFCNSDNAYLGSLWDYFGLPVNTSGNLSGISALPFRGVYLIYNEWVRDENLQKSVKIQKGDANEVLNSTRAAEQPSWVFTSDTSYCSRLSLSASW